MTDFARKDQGDSATIRKKHREGAEKRKDMTETIYEKKAAVAVTGRQLPNNRRQIGNPGQAEPEVFIEDYAFSFAKSLSERDYTGCVVGVLVGEYVEEARGDKLLVRGVLEAKDVLRHDMVCFTETIWAGIYRDIREYFPAMQIVGWFLGGPGFLLEDTERQKKIQEDNFGGGDKVLLKMDSIEKEQKFHFYREGEMQELPGYYIYYERNKEMQSYMAETGRNLPEENSREVLVREEPPVYTEKRTPVKEEKMPEFFYRLFYATGGVLTCIAVLVIAGLAMQIRERNRLEELLNEQEKLVSALQQVYIAEEGETIASICMKFYGSTEQEAAVRLLNSLEEGEEPEEGQKIFLP